ncbi:MAG: mandelate racemase/muconate lactonizing enzyme family protein [Ferruginibacter sp.]
MSNSRRSFLSKAAMAAAMAPFAPLAAFGKPMEDAIDRTPKFSAPTDLKIESVTPAFIRGVNSLYIKITTNQGIVGYGEGVDAVPGTYHLVKRFGNRLRGRNPLDVNRLFEEIRKGGIFEGAQAGMYVAVLSAIEIALWDIAGKALNVPVYQLLGGKFRDKIRVYYDTVFYAIRNPPIKEYIDAGKKGVSMGFTALKYDIDEASDPSKYDRYNWTMSPGELIRMEEQIAAAREAVGPKIDICVDMHGRYDAVTAQAVAKRLEKYNLMWLEEPMPTENIDAYKALTDSTSIPICYGENNYLAHGFRRALEIGAVDIVMPDLQKTGGLGEGQRIANLANLYYKPFSPHMVASFLGCMASCHVCASVPNFMILEWQAYFHTNPMWKEIVKYDGEWVKDGFISLSEKPGIGVDLNEEGMKKYALPDVPFFV